MVALSNHPLRALSPITELNTPTSLRTLQLPFEEGDYHSERYSHSHPERDDDDEDDASVYSQLSAETVRDQSRNTIPDEEIPVTPVRQRTVSLPTTSPSPIPPSRIPRRIIPSAKPISTNHSMPFPQAQLPTPTSTPAPGGLPPPPRTQVNNNKPKLIRRVTPPTTPTAHPTNQLNVPLENSGIEAARDISGMNMAGIGVGRSLSQESRARSTSLYASPLDRNSRIDIPEDNPPRTAALDLSNVPILADFELQGSKTPPRSRPNSLKKRPKSFHGSKPNSIRSRPNSFHESSSNNNSTVKLVTPALGLDPLTTPMQVQAEVTIGSPNSYSESQETDRPTLVSHQSESSLPSRTKSNRSTSPTKKSPRRRRVSSIFSSIFGVDQDKEHIARKLSKNSRKTSGSGVASRGSSGASSPNSPHGMITDSPVQEDIDGPIQSAIRTSGTFGIRDDGSEISAGGHPGRIGSPSARHTFDRTGSGNGSVITRSEGVKRVLYVENLVSTPEAELELKEVKNERQASENSGSGSTASEHRTPPHSKVTPIAMMGLLPLPGNGQPNQLQITQSPGSDSGVTSQEDQQSATGLTPNLILTNYPSSASSSDDHHRTNLTFNPARSLSTPTSTDVQYSSSSHLPLSGISENMVDESVQTSLQSSPAKSTRSRPLPRPPSTSTPPVATPRPTFIPPLPPSSTPSNELPLLIASHLLSTHAAALIRHSGTMKEASETMHKMARESLDWEGVLMGMANRVDPAEGLPKIPEHHPVGGYEGIPLPRPAAFSPRPEIPRSATSTGYGPAQNANTLSDPQNPIQQAYSALIGDPVNPPSATRPGMEGKISSTQVRRKKGESLPADLLKEAKRLGNEGWTNLHKAEEAWSEAMRGLAEIVSSQGTVDPNDQDGVTKSVAPQVSIASIKPNLVIDPVLYKPSADAQDTLNPPLSPYTSLSYPLGFPNSTIHRHTSMSFLPDDRDMRFAPTPSASTSSQSHTSFPHPRASSHPFQNPLNGISAPQGRPEIRYGVERGSESTIKIRPQSIQPTSDSSHPFPTYDGGSQGYTSDHLGFNSPSTRERMSSSHEVDMEERKTPSRSTMTSSSHSPNDSKSKGKGGSTLKGTGGRKLAKKQHTSRVPTPIGSIKGSGIFGNYQDGDNAGTGTGIGTGKNGSSLKLKDGSEKEGKKHWWNKK